MKSAAAGGEHQGSKELCPRRPLKLRSKIAEGGQMKSPPASVGYTRATRASHSGGRATAGNINKHTRMRIGGARANQWHQESAARAWKVREQPRRSSSRRRRRRG